MLEYVLFVIGGALLYVGAEQLITGASRLATRFGVSPITIGLTIVAYGTSLPEFVVSTKAAVGGSGDIAMGNVLGSNICNIALILGAGACLRPLAVHNRLLSRELPFLMVLSGVVALFVTNGLVGRIEGLILFGVGGFFTLALFRDAVRQDQVSAALPVDVPNIDPGALSGSGAGADFVKILIGLTGLFFGGAWFVDGAIAIARDVGVSETMIGLSLVAFGTSVPELATVLVAIKNGEDDIGVGNLVGSNIFNLTIVLGGTASIHPVPFAGGSAWSDLIIAFALPLVLVPTLRKGTISRGLGVLLVFIYVGYIAQLVFTH